MVLGYSGGSNGTVWWDNVSIRRVNSSNTIEIVEENAYYPWKMINSEQHVTIEKTIK